LLAHLLPHAGTRFRLSALVTWYEQWVGCSVISNTENVAQQVPFMLHMCGYKPNIFGHILNSKQYCVGTVKDKQKGAKKAFL
jgi:hypothetical protein